jgi:hypothetical protein
VLIFKLLDPLGIRQVHSGKRAPPPVQGLLRHPVPAANLAHRLIVRFALDLHDCFYTMTFFLHGLTASLWRRTNLETGKCSLLVHGLETQSKPSMNGLEWTFQ